MPNRIHIAMFTRFADFWRSPFTIAILVSAYLLALPSLSAAQDEGLTFEQAQTRTAFAREQMEAARRELKELEALEETALRELEQAQANADRVTQQRKSAEQKHQQAKDHWSRESERLKRIHQRSILNNPNR
jgi:type II secretory pathway pseudopilin PulG